MTIAWMSASGRELPMSPGGSNGRYQHLAAGRKAQVNQLDLADFDL